MEDEPHPHQPINPNDDLQGAIAERGLRPELTVADVLAYDAAVKHARVELLGGALLLHPSQRPVGYDDYPQIAHARGLNVGSGWREIAQSYRKPSEDEGSAE